MYIFAQVRADMIGIIKQTGELKRAGIVEIPARNLGNYRLGASILSREESAPCYDLGLGVREEAIKPPDHD